MVRVIVCLFFISMAFSASAQLHYGFKTGLNFSRIDGPSEQDNAGNDLEEWNNITGFLIGLGVSYGFNEYFSVKSELMYSKKGSKYEFEGPGYRYFRDANSSTLTYGNARYVLKINNSYLDLPVMAVGKWKRLELAGGVYGAVLLQSIADGSLTYTNGRTAQLNNPVDSVRYTLDHNYRRDSPGGGDFGETFTVKVDNKTVSQPKTTGAYFDDLEDNGSLYNAFDFGLIGELSFFLSEGLYLSGRVQYGLADLTRNEADLSKARVADGGALLYRDDKDRNFTLQAILGFSF